MATVAVGAATLPSWVRRAFADASLTRDTPQPSTARAALERARDRRRPFVAIVIPEDDDGKRTRGELFGEYLMNATEEQLAPLAACELAAVPIEELRTSVKLTGVPLALRIEPSGEVATVGAEVAPPRVGAKRAMSDEAGAERVIDERVAFVAQQMATLTGHRDAALLRRRALVAAALLGADERARLDGAGDARAIDALPLGLVERGAPILEARATEASPTVRAAILRALGRSVAARVRGGRVPGSHWARASGCGLDEVEGMPERGEVIAMDCGMGHVPPRASRFLYFYSQTPSERWRAARSK
jgi:hypothetical protein